MYSTTSPRDKGRRTTSNHRPTRMNNSLGRHVACSPYNYEVLIRTGAEPPGGYAVHVSARASITVSLFLGMRGIQWQRAFQKSGKSEAAVRASTHESPSLTFFLFSRNARLLRNYSSAIFSKTMKHL